MSTVNDTIKDTDVSKPEVPDSQTSVTVQPTTVGIIETTSESSTKIRRRRRPHFISVNATRNITGTLCYYLKPFGRSSPLPTGEASHDECLKTLADTLDENKLQDHDDFAKRLEAAVKTHNEDLHPADPFKILWTEGKTNRTEQLLARLSFGGMEDTELQSIGER